MAVAESSVVEVGPAVDRAPNPITYRPTPNSHLPSLVWKALVYLILIVGGVIFVAPFAWMVTASLQDVSDIFRWPPQLIPLNPSLDNFLEFFEKEHIGTPFLNSANVPISVTPLQTLCSSLAAC